MKIFFDLDGTILDSKPRLYQLFQNLVPESNLSFEDYWKFKMNKIGHKELLSTKFEYSEKQYQNFEDAWMQKIESPECLALDKPFDGVINYLTKLKEKHSVYVVTARQNRIAVIEQITNHGFNHLFDGIFVTGQKKEKFDLINGSIQTNDTDWFVGDTGKDIQTGKMLGMKTAAVLSGFLNKEKLKDYHPDVIVANVMCLNF